MQQEGNTGRPTPFHVLDGFSGKVAESRRRTTHPIYGVVLHDGIGNSPFPGAPVVPPAVRRGPIQEAAERERRALLDHEHRQALAFIAWMRARAREQATQNPDMAAALLQGAVSLARIEARRPKP